MKKLSELTLIVLLAACTSNATGPTCPSIAATLSIPNQVLPGNTCGHNSGFASAYSDTLAFNAAGTDSYQLDIGSAFSIDELRVESTGFATTLTLPGPPCAARTACFFTDSISAPGTVVLSLGTNPAPGTC